MTDHSRIEELLAVRALGGLEADDERELERELAAHGPACPECTRVRIESDETAGRLAFALTPEPVDEGLEDRIVALALAERPAGSPAGARPPGVGNLAERRGGRRRGARWGEGTGWRGLAALAAAFVLFAGGWVVGGALREDAPIDLRSARLVDFETETGSLSAAFDPGEPGVVLLGSELPSPGEGKVYELWMIRGDRPPIPGGCLTPGESGSVAELLDAEVGSTDTMAVTIEPASCSTAPTTEPIAVAQLT